MASYSVNDMCWCGHIQLDHNASGCFGFLDSRDHTGCVQYSLCMCEHFDLERTDDSLIEGES
jgi:hypothetical protein